MGPASKTVTRADMSVDSSWEKDGHVNDYHDSHEDSDDELSPPPEESESEDDIQAYVAQFVEYYDDLDDELNQDIQSQSAPQNDAVTPSPEDDQDLEPLDGLEAIAAAQTNASGSVLESSQPNALVPKKRYPFPKLTSTEDFKAYLANPEEMTSEELYRRTSIVSKILGTWQDEHWQLDKEISAYETHKKAATKLIEEEQKQIKEKKQAVEDLESLRLLDLFPKVPKLSVADYNDFMESFSANYPGEPPKSAELLLGLRQPATLARVKKARQGKSAQPEKPVLDLVGKPYPRLTAADLEPHAKVRKFHIDPVIWEDKKMTDVYGVPYSSSETKIGYQDLKPRAKPNPEDVEIENGRPRRGRGKRAVYETDPETPGVSEAEEPLPAKRKRTQRILEPSAAFEDVAQPSRNTTPAPNITKAGKRMGRPPGSKTKKGKLAGSKLQQVEAATVTEVPEAAVLAPEVQQVPVENEIGDEIVEQEVLQSTEVDDESRLPSTAASSRPTTASGRGSTLSDTRRVTRASTTQRGQGEVELARLPTPPVKKRGGKRKGAEAPAEVTTRLTKKQKMDVGKEEEEESQTPPEVAEVSSRRPKRKRAATNSESTIQVALPGDAEEFQDDQEDDTTPPAPKRRKGGKTLAAKKGREAPLAKKPPPRARKASGKAAAEAENSTPATGPAVSESPRKSTRPKKPSRIVMDLTDVDNAEEGEASAPQIFPSVYEEYQALSSPKGANLGKRQRKQLHNLAGVMEDQEDAEEMTDEPPAKKRATRPPKQTKTIKVEEDEAVDASAFESAVPAPEPKKKSRAKSKSRKTDEPSTDEEGLTEAEKAARLKKKQKSAKLAEATRKRWADGRMAGPMKKRKETNDAKKAAKAVEKAVKIKGKDDGTDGGAFGAGPSGASGAGSVDL